MQRQSFTMVTAHGLHYPLELSSHMQPTDALFWYAEQATPELRPLVAGLLMLDRRPARPRMHASVERWIARLPRLRQRVVEAPLGLGLPEWEEDPHFEPEYHAREVILPHPATERHLLDFIGSVFATPLDPMRPLWEAYLVEGLAGGKAACFFKAHHSVMDGVGSLAVFDALTQSRRNEVVRVPRAAPLPPSNAATGLGHMVREAVGDAASGLAAAAAGAARGALRPLAMIEDMGRAMRGVRGLIADLTATTTDDPVALSSTGIGRRLDVMTLSLPRLVHVKDALGATLNDVVLTAVAGAVGRYHARRKMPVAELHCMVPMSLRQSGERRALGNRVGAFNVALPVGEPDPLARLARIRQQTNAAKSDRRGAAYPLLTRALSFMPGAAYRMLAQSATRHVNLICTNMPGPPTERYLAGARVDRIHPFAPVALGVPLSIALMSYGDSYGIGIDTDPAAIPDVERLHDDLRAAVDEIEHCASSRSRRRVSANGAGAATKKPRRSRALVAGR
jgi:diacylglycerol O-acyltransferase / wax synthase